ncbi:glycosyltransferase family 4 protein [Larkinella bovis]|uniref:Glycosyltransferase family 4 protein n=1 Tax=Larkinella bovis TaxID=683041 RepID=A0ABW0I9B8_9BACT
MSGILYLMTFGLLFGAEVLYIRLAIRFRIIDQPNERSSHTRPTVRGGGIVFWLAACLAFVYQGFVRPFFFAGLTLVALISFLDDRFSLPRRYRFLVQLLSIGLLFRELQLEQVVGLWWIPGLVIGACGILNAYNFMDGINGITAFYSLVAGSTLLYINQLVEPFTEPLWAFFFVISLLVFTFFNARRKARCFAGDVGSISAGFIILFLLAGLLLKSGTLTYGLLLAVYGVDSGLTILHRLWLRENIFRPHKLHLFQLLVHRWQWSHLRVSAAYAGMQLVVNGAVLWLVQQKGAVQAMGSLGIVLILMAGYGWLKNRLLNQKPQTKPVAADAI